MNKLASLLLLAILSVNCAFSQTQDSLAFTYIGEYHYKTDFPAWNYFNYSAFFDRAGKSYVYGACGELGLSVIDISDPSAPVLDNYMAKGPNFDGLAVTHLQQQNELLYVSIGSFSSIFNVPPGLAIVDVSDPTSPSVVDIWTDTSLTQGTAVVRLRGNHAYLGAMEDGVIALDISDSSNIQLASRYVPDSTYPSWNTLQCNARGMNIRNDTLFLAYDSGGLRLIDISNPDSMFQLGQYVDSLMWFGPPATPVTNHVVVRGNYGFATNDYCGLSSVNFTDADSMYTADWWNPWSCKDTTGMPAGQNSTWFSSDGHTNELADYSNEIILMTGGDSEVYAIDVSNPANLRVAGQHVVVGDSEVVWGLDYYNGRTVLAYVRNPWEFPLQPYIGNWGGIKIFDVNMMVGREELQSNSIQVWPNPAGSFLNVENSHRSLGVVQLYDAFGRIVLKENFTKKEVQLDVNDFPAGIYFLNVQGITRKVILN